jgi:hypothetical protein
MATKNVRGDSFGPLWIAPDQMGKELVSNRLGRRKLLSKTFLSPVCHLVRAPLQAPSRVLTCTYMSAEELL